MAVKSPILTDLLKKQGLALESEELASADSAEVPEVEEVIEATTEVEADGAAVEEAVEGAEQLEEAAVALEAICLAMESSLKSTRGMGARELAMTQRFAGHVLSSIGVAVPSSYVALESIEDAEALQAAEPAVVPVEAPAEGAEAVEEDPALAARAERTEVALEGFKEMASKMKDALLKMWEKIKEMANKFFSSLWVFAKGQQVRINMLLKKLGKAGEIDGEVDASKLSSLVVLVGSKNLDSASVVKALKSMVKTTGEVYGSYLKALGEHAKGGPAPTMTEGAIDGVEGLKIGHTGDFYKVEGVKQEGTPEGKVKVTKADLETILKTQLEMLEEVKKFGQTWKATQSAIESAIKATVDSESDEAAKEKAKVAANAKRSAMRGVSNLPVQWGRVVIKATNAVLTYVSKASKIEAPAAAAAPAA